MRSIQRGFTLVELMIVVAIIGLLAAIAIPAYREYVAVSHGGGAMKGLQGFVAKAQACTASGIGCGTLAKEIDATSRLSGVILENSGGSITWDDGFCAVTVVINASGGVEYSATSTGSGVSVAQCEKGAGL